MERFGLTKPRKEARRTDEPEGIKSAEAPELSARAHSTCTCTDMHCHKHVAQLVTMLSPLRGTSIDESKGHWLDTREARWRRCSHARRRFLMSAGSSRNDVGAGVSSFGLCFQRVRDVLAAEGAGAFPAEPTAQTILMKRMPAA